MQHIFKHAWLPDSEDGENKLHYKKPKLLQVFFAYFVHEVIFNTLVLHVSCTKKNTSCDIIAGKEEKRRMKERQREVS